MKPSKTAVLTVTSIIALSAAPPAALADYNKYVSAVVTFYLSDEELDEDQDEQEELVRHMAKLEAQNKCARQYGDVQTTNFEELFPGWSGTGHCHHSTPDPSAFYPQQATRARCTGTYMVRCRLPDIRKATDDFVKAPRPEGTAQPTERGNRTPSAYD